MPPVRGGVKQHILRAPLDAAFEHGFQRLVIGVGRVEREIVAKDEKAMRRVPQLRHEHGQAVDILAVDLDQFQRPHAIGGEPRVDIGMGGLDEGGFAHAPRAPQKRVIGGKAARETLGVVGQKIAQPVDAAQQRHLDPVDLAHRI